MAVTVSYRMAGAWVLPTLLRGGRRTGMQQQWQRQILVMLLRWQRQQQLQMDASPRGLWHPSHSLHHPQGSAAKAGQLLLQQQLLPATLVGYQMLSWQPSRNRRQQQLHHSRNSSSSSNARSRLVGLL